MLEIQLQEQNAFHERNLGQLKVINLARDQENYLHLGETKGHLPLYPPPKKKTMFKCHLCEDHNKIPKRRKSFES